MNCKSCKHWKVGDYQSGLNIPCGWPPVDPDTHEPMDIGYEVRCCASPKLLFYEMPIDSTYASLIDGSHYHARMATAGDFGCVNYEATP